MSTVFTGGISYAQETLLKLKTSRICVVILQRTCANVSEGESAPVN